MTRRLTNDQVNARIRPQGIRLLSPWQGNKKWHTFECLACQHTWQAQGGGPINAKSGCPQCNSFPYFPKLTTEEVRQRLVPRGIELIGEWQNADKNNQFRCRLGHKWETQGRSVLTEESDCPECSRLHQKSRTRYGIR